MATIDARIGLVESERIQSEPQAAARSDVALVLPVVASVGESGWRRAIYLVLAIALTVAFGFFILSFSAPAPGRAGIDENAYLVGGRMIAEHGTYGFKPGDDYQFVGAMWMRTPSGWYYPKYPFGTSLLNAAMILLNHRTWAFAVQPMCATLALLGMFFLARPVVGSFYALLAVIVLAMGPTTLQLAITPNSHAPALFFTVWGMALLLQWLKNRRIWVGALAGLMLGYAVTIRYTEALLLFPLYSLDVIRTDGFIGPRAHAIFRVLGLLPIGPIGIAVLSRVKWKCWRSYITAGVPVIAWAAPVFVLVAYNHHALGHFTGYDSTNESDGFSLNYLIQKWDFAVNQLYLLGLFVMAPLAVGGLVLMYRSSRRIALMMTAWFVPGAFLYMSYYWGQGVPGVWYLRFFLTLFPPMIVAAMYMLKSTQPAGRGSIVSPLAAGILTAAASGVGLWVSMGELIRVHRGNMNLHYTAREIIAHVDKTAKAKPMILCDKGMFPLTLQYMQFMYDADWYQNDVFSLRAGGGFGLAGVFEERKENEDRPVTLQQERIKYMKEFRKGKTDTDFINDAHDRMEQALLRGAHIYLVVDPTEATYFRNRFITGAYQMTELTHWSEPCAIKFGMFGDHSDLAPRNIEDSPVLPWHPQRWAMFEITRSATRG